MRRHLAAKRLKDALDGHLRHLRPRRDAGAADVRRDNDVVQRQQRVVEGHRLDLRHVQPGRGDASLLQRRVQRPLVDDRAARRVHQHRRRLHQRQLPLADEVSRLRRKRHVQADEVRLAQQLLEARRIPRRAPPPPAGAASGRGRGCACRSRGRVAPPPARSARGRRCPASRRARPVPGETTGASVFQPPVRVSRSPSTTRRAAASRSANARSAVVSVRTPGVLVTRMPRSVAAATSTLS